MGMRIRWQSPVNPAEHRRSIPQNRVADDGRKRRVSGTRLQIIGNADPLELLLLHG